jgi:hypothetical protein
MNKKPDRNISALRGAIKSLNRSTSRQMLKANLDFIWDYFIAHPSRELPNRLKADVEAGK